MADSDRWFWELVRQQVQNDTDQARADEAAREAGSRAQQDLRLLLRATPEDTAAPTIVEGRRRGASWLGLRSMQRSPTILGGVDYARAGGSDELDPDRLWGFKTLGGR